MDTTAKRKTASRIKWWKYLVPALLAEAIFFAWTISPPGANRRSDINLIDACSQGNLAYADILLALGADPLTRRTAPGFALMAAVMGGHTKIVGKLLSSGANVDASDPEDHETPLMMAVYLDNTAMARYLISKGADPNIKNRRGESAMQEAVRQKKYAIINDLKHA